MLLPDRRSLLALAGCALALTACGFTPAYGPQGNASALLGQVSMEAPTKRSEFLLFQRIEERLGRATNDTMLLSVSLDIKSEGLGTTSEGETTRYHRIGRAYFDLRDTATKTVLTSGTVTSFTGYSATGSTVATLAAKTDATERLMTILADQIIDRLILAAPDLPK